MDECEKNTQLCLIDSVLKGSSRIEFWFVNKTKYAWNV